MFSRLLILFIVVPMIELALLIEVGKQIGFWPTVGI
ncbi:MAG: FxsA family protein, partial [Rhodothermales bacterium]